MDNFGHRRHYKLFTDYIASRTSNSGTLAIVRKELALPGDVSERVYAHMPVLCNNDCANCPMENLNAITPVETHTHQWTCIKNYHQDNYQFDTEDARYDDDDARYNDEICYLYDNHCEHLVQNFYAAIQATAYPELAGAKALDLPVRLAIKDHHVYLDQPSFRLSHCLRLALEVQVRSELEKDFEEELIVHKLTT